MTVSVASAHGGFPELGDLTLTRDQCHSSSGGKEDPMTTNNRRDSPGELIVLDQRAPEQAAEDKCPAVRVLLAEGEKLVRAGLRGLLEDGGTVVEGEAASGREAVLLASDIRPDVVLINARLPDLDGLEATRRITTDPELSQVRVLILSEDEGARDLFGAVRAGASGFLTRDTAPAELLRAVRALAGGGVHLSRRREIRPAKRCSARGEELPLKEDVDDHAD
jgi:CheY-like chemotaxis protein